MPFPNELTQFKPGQSGNPNGRPKKLPEIDELLAEALGYEQASEAKEILKALVAKAKKGDVRAAEVLFDRAYGKANQYIKEDIHQRIDITWNEPGDINLPNTQDQGSNGVVQSFQVREEDNS